MTRRSSWAGVVASCSTVAAVLAGPVLADEEVGGISSAHAPQVIVEPLLPPLGRAIVEDGLAVQRGGQDDAYANINDARARVSETSVTNASTGNNIVSEGSITNNSGLPVVVQNSGNGVVIQNTTILNLQLK
jgi:hypothetical protein